MEDYNIYYLKLKKQTKELFVMTLAAIIVHLGYGYLGIIVDLGRKIGDTERFTLISSSVITVCLIIAAIINFIIMRKADRKSFNGIKGMITAVRVVLFSCIAYIGLIAAGILLSVFLCFFSAFLLAFPIFEAYGDWFGELFMFVPGAGCGIFCFVFTVKAEKSFKELKSYIQDKR